MGKKVKIKPVVVTVDPVIVADPVDVPAPPAPVVPVLPPLVLTPGFTAHIDLIGVTAGQAHAGAMLYGPRDFAAWGFNFDVAAPAGLASVGNVELRIASGDGEVALFKLQQAPFGWLPPSGLEVAPQILPTQPDPANFLWVSQIGTLEDTDGYNANQTGGYLNLGSLGIEYAFGADYRNVGEHYDVDILLNGAVQAHQSIDVII
tara:strand:+ start:1075 stop:1686 length:612 start_codon:yes stop_codon:yes gene_type:complete